MKGPLLSGGRRPITAAVSLLAVVAVVTVNMFVAAFSPQPTDAPASGFSAERAQNVLADIATKPRPLGSAESDRVRDRLADDLRELGFDVAITEDVGGEVDDNAVVFGRTENVVATLPGSDPTGRVLLVSHYDSVAAGPGAGDAGTPVAAIMETARALTERPAPRNDVVVLLTDGEESGLLGADAYARANPSRGDDVVLNVEARGTDGPSLMFETSPGNSRLIDVYARAAPHTTGDSSMVEVYRHMPNGTDFTNFSAAGYAGLNSANIGSPSWYHTPGDSLEHVDASTLQHHGDNLLGLAADFSGEDLSTIDSGTDTVYFHFLGGFVSYSPGWGVALAIIGLVMAAAAVVLARRRRLLSLPRLGVAVATVPVALLLAAAAAQAMWSAMTFVRSGLADTGGMLHGPVPFVIAAGLLSAAAVLTWYLTLRRVLGAAALGLAGLIWLSGLGAVLAVVAPGAAFRLSIPALFAAWGVVAALILDRRGPRWTAAATLTVGMVPAAVILMSTGVDLAEAFGLSLALAPALLFALAGVVGTPLVEWWLAEPAEPRRRFGWAPPALAAAMAVVVCGFGLSVAGPTTDEPRPTYLAYVLDADDETARWASLDTDTSPWTGKHLTQSGDAEALPWGYREPGSPFPHYGNAPLADLPAPTAEVERDGDRLRVHLESRRGADNLTLRTSTAVTEVTAEVPGRDPVTKTLTAAGTDPWGASITFLDPPESGVDLTLTLADDADAKLTVYDRSDGLGDIPGVGERPAAEMRSPIRSSDTVTVLTELD